MVNKILVVDDDPRVIEELISDLEEEGYEITSARSKKDAGNIISMNPPFDLAIVDMKLATDEEGGLDVIKEVRDKDSLSEIIVLTAYGSLENVYKAMKYHIWNYIDKKMKGIIAENVILQVKEALKHKQNIQEGTFLLKRFIKCLSAILDSNEPYKIGHSERVAKYSEIIAKKLGKTDEEIEEIKMAAQMHDIGKIKINTWVLHKPGKLDDEEWAMIKIHPIEGYKIISKTPGLEHLAEPIRQHHERYDGQGYPGEVEGDKILEYARIIALADTFDAMTSDRPHRPRKSIDEAIEEIRTKCRGTQHDPKIVDAFLKAYEDGLIKPIIPYKEGDYE